MMKSLGFFAGSLIAFAAVFTACPDGTAGPGGSGTGNGTDPEGPKVSGVFITAPELTFSRVNAPENCVRYHFTGAVLHEGITGNITYRLIYAENIISKSEDIIADSTARSAPGAAPGITGDIQGDDGAIFSAVVYAFITYNGELSETYSAVKQSQVAPSVTFERGTGTLQSIGRATAHGAITYYIDYERGDDQNSGRSPRGAWKTLTKVNNTTFYPGDRILLEANSTWNGTPTVGNFSRSGIMNEYTASDPNFPAESNYRQLMAARGNGGMLAPQGAGAAENPIIIDLYEFNEAASTVYFSANRRPIINGNGTPALPGPRPPPDSYNGDLSAQGEDSPYWVSGAVHFQEQDYWQVRNVELSNSYDFPYIANDRRLRETHFFRRDVPKDLAGVAMIEKTNPNAFLKGIVIEYCYIHDTQSTHRISGGRPWSDEFEEGRWMGRKSGAITGNLTESTIQYNIIRNIGAIGILTGDWYITDIRGNNIVIRGNYLENIAADGIVTCFQQDALIESNIAKNTVASPIHFADHASIWCYALTRGLYQYNESYGSMYGGADGEAWDIDSAGNWVIFQYNYSHHNAGGTLLLMENQTNSIFRYNISVNDGSGPLWLDAVADYNMTEWFGQIGVDQGNSSGREIRSYTAYPRGAQVFHVPGDAQNADAAIPLIHNNTIYVGDGYDVAIIGNGAVTSNRDKRVRFFNNIILKQGEGLVRLVDSADYALGNFRGVLRNNIFWSTDDDRSHFTGDTPGYFDHIVNNSASGVNAPITIGNMWINPRLRIQSMPAATLPVSVPGNTTVPPSVTQTAEIKTELKRQLDEGFPITDVNDPEKIKSFAGPSRLRMRAQYFSPETGSPAIEGGFQLPVSGSATAGIHELDGAWNGHNGVDDLSIYPTSWSSSTGVTHDFFGKPINSAKPPIGAAAGPVSF